MKKYSLDQKRGRWRRRPLVTATCAAIVTTLLGGCVVKPDPITTPQNLKSAALDAAMLVSETQQVNRVIDLNQAIARALKHNRSRRVSLMESVLASNKLELAHFDMLPKLSAKAGYKERDRLALSSSGTLSSEDGQFRPVTPPAYSASAYEISHTVDLDMTWNVLDFGLSYVRAEQQADHYLISRERERKAIHNLITDVRSAYWRAASAQRLLKQIAPLMERVNVALEDSRQIEQQRLQSPIDALTYQRELLDIRRSLESLHRDLKDSTTTLATLMGMKPGTVFELEGIERSGYQVLDLKLDLETLEKTALAKRPELIESRYQKRITHADSRAALLALLPGIDLSYGSHRDENSFLLYNRWEDWGAKVSFNIFNLFKAPAMQNKVESDRQVAEAKRLALSAAVISQVHLAAVAYDQSRQEFVTSSEYLSVVERIRQHMQVQRDVERSGELSLIREELSSVLAQLRRDISYAGLQNSYGRIFTTAGLDPLPEQLQDNEIETISKALETQFEQWKRGEVGLVAAPLSEQISPWHGPGEHQFAFSDETFSLGGAVHYRASMQNGSALPEWIEFDPQSRILSGNPPASLEQLDIQIEAENQSGARARDQFVLALQETNDPPIASAAALYQVVEDGDLLRGNIASMDADGDPLKFVLAPNQKVPAGLTINPDGSWVFNPADPQYQPLAAGESVTQTVRLHVTDPYGGRGESELTIEISGTNDAPTIESVVNVEIEEDGAVQRGVLQVVDVDHRAAATFQALNPKLPAGFTLEQDGAWRFDPGQAVYQALKEGDSRSQFVMIKVSDEQGASDRTQMQFTVKGRNDAPQISQQQVMPLLLRADNGYSAKLPATLFSDPEGEVFTLGVEQSGLFGAATLPTWLRYDATTQTVSARAAEGSDLQGAQLTLLVTATDPHGATASRRVPLELSLPAAGEQQTEKEPVTEERTESLAEPPSTVVAAESSASTEWWATWGQNGSSGADE